MSLTVLCAMMPNATAYAGGMQTAAPSGDDYGVTDVARITAWYTDAWGNVKSYRTNLVYSNGQYYVMDDTECMFGGIINRNPEYGTNYDWTSPYNWTFKNSGGITCYFYYDFK